MNFRVLVAGLAVLAASFCARASEPPQLPPVPPAAFAAIPPLPKLVAPALPPLTVGAEFPQGIKLSEFARVVLSDVLKAQYVFSSEFLASSAQVGFSAKKLKEVGTEALLRDVLAQHGFAVEFRAGYYRVFKSLEAVDGRQDFFYRLQHRDLGYISMLIQPLFSSGSFTFQRTNNVAAPERSPQQGGSASGGRPVDTGNSLMSMTTQAGADTLLFRGLPSEVERLKTVLAQVDVPIPRVLVRGLVLEVMGSERDGYGVSAVAKLLSGKLSISLGGTGIPDTLSFKSASFEAVAGVLDTSSRVRVVTAPSVHAETGATASFMVGNSVPTLGSIQFDDKGGARQSIEYRDTGVLFKVTPRVLDASIGLSVLQEISDAAVTQSGVEGSPTITKRSLSTVLNTTSGEWVILGGLKSLKRQDSEERLPFFGLRTGKGAQSDTSEIVLLLYVELQK